VIRSRVRAIAAACTARRLVVLLVALVLAALGTSRALGFWTPGDAHGNAVGSATVMNQGPTPTAARDLTSAVVTWGVAIADNGTAANGYIVRRYDAGTSVEQTIRAGCNGVIAATTCSETGMPDGTWKYTITPVMGDNWRGQEGPRSGVVQFGPTTLTLDRTLFGPPLPAVATGTLRGFQPNEGIRYTLDGATIAGAPSSVAADGTATITSMSIPSGLPDGSYTIQAIGNASSLAEASILIDTTPPKIDGFITPAANAAGWNDTSPVEVNGTVDDGNGSGIAYVKYTDDGTDPRTSPTAQYALTPPMATVTTTYKFYGVDLAGNASAVQTLLVKIDTIAPIPASVTLVNVTGGAWLDLPNLKTYYRGAAAGSYQYDIGVSDPGAGASGPASASDSALSGTDAGFTNASGTVTTPPGGPYVLDPISWAAGTTSNPVGTVTLTDVAGNTLVTSGQVVNDSAAPAGGSVDASGLSGPGGSYSTSLTLNLSLAKGSDSGSGLADGSAPTDLPDTLTRASAPLISSDGIADGTCGTYSSYVQVQANNPPFTLTDTVPADDTCYRYQYLVADHVGNLATYTSPDIKVQTAAAPSLTPSGVTLTAVSGINSQSVTGTTVYYNPAQSGSFNVDATASAPYSGVAQMNYPAIAGFTGGGAVTSPLTGTTFRATYEWSANGTSPSPGPQPLSATNYAGQTATNPTAFSIISDAAGPSGGSVDATGLSGTGGRYSSSTTLNVAFSPGIDSGAGLAATGAQLLRASASLTSNGVSNGTCGTFGAYTQVGANDPSSPVSNTVSVDGTCYRYQYVVADKLGNQSPYTSPDIKIDSAAPTAPALTFTGLSNAIWNAAGTTLYYRPAAGSGGFTLTASSADSIAGISAYTLPTLPAGWTNTPGASGVQSYSWASPNPTAPTNPLTVTATNNTGWQSSATFTTLPDSTAPTLGSVSYTNGTISAGTTTVTFASGGDAGSGLAAGSALLQRSSATLSGGVCGTFGAFSTIATAPTSPYTDTVAGNTCYQYRYQISDNVGNQATFPSANVLKVTPSPTNALSLVNPVGAYLLVGSLYYNPLVQGSFRLLDALAAPGSGPASVTYPAINSENWTHNAETVTTPSGGPFTSSLFSWNTQPNTPPRYTVTGKDNVGGQSTTQLTFIQDQSGPTGGSISYPSGIVNTPSVSISTSAGSDGGSGVNLAGSVVERDSTPLNTATDSCNGFPATFATTITLVGGADTSASNGNCYQYRYLASDNVGNVRTYNSSNIVKLDTTPKVTIISNGGNGQLELNDQLTITFNENLAPATVPTTFSGATETRPTTGFTQVTIPGITNGALDMGSNAYLAGSQGLGIKTATFAGTVALNNNGSSTTITLTVTGLSGDPTATGQGPLTFRLAPTITGVDGTASTATFVTSGGFRLF
jgi:hypothetical protein